MAIRHPALRFGRASVPHLDRHDRIDLLLGLSVVALVAMTLVIALVPAIHGHAVAPEVDLALDTMAALVSGAVAVLAWTRFRDGRSPLALYQAGAFLALTTGYALALAATLGRAPIVDLGRASVDQVHVFAVAHVVAGVLLVLGGWATLRRREPTRTIGILLAPALAVLAVGVVTQLPGGAPFPLVTLVVQDGDGSVLPMTTPLGVGVQAVTAGLLFVAAGVCRAVWRRDGEFVAAWLAVALVFAAFAEIQWAFYPSGHPGQVSSGDLLRVAFFVALLLAIEADMRATLTRLRIANVQLAALRDAELDRAALEERTRLARELHDGLAQDLWLAKLRAGQLAASGRLGPAGDRLLAEATSAIDMGLAEARQAVLALRMTPDEEHRFPDLLARYVADIEDRFGIRVALACEGDLSRLAPRTQAETLRIVQEALANVSRHAHATVVGVRIRVRGPWFRACVADDGRGFDPGAAGAGSYGLASMRERAALVGARLRVESTRGEGTRVVLVGPVAGGPREQRHARA